MSSRRPWPEGVPPLLEKHNPDYLIVFSLLRAKRRCSTWKEKGTWYSPRKAMHQAEAQPRHIPRVVVSMRHNAIIYSNAAARAIGIVPQGEREQDDEPRNAAARRVGL